MGFQGFLPYQQRWINDLSRFKIAEKSRRTGFTFGQAYEDVDYSVEKAERKVWFSSRDDSAAVEYIDYCAFFIKKTFGMAAEFIGDDLIDPEKDITAHVIRFKNGSKITAMSSSPGRFRSKGGKVVMDEFAFHDSQEELYAAAMPVILRNDPLRIISTYNGKGNMYYKLVNRVRNGELNWSLHKVDIFLAVNEGLYDSIMGRPTTEQEREDWLSELKRNCASEETWLQEFCCIPVDSATAFLPYDLLATCEKMPALLYKDLADLKGCELYAGIDIGRKQDLTVIWIDEKIAGTFYTRHKIELKNMPFSEQKQILFPILAMPEMRRACIDATGIGMQLAEEAAQMFGTFKIEPVMFTQKSKEDMAHRVKRYLEDRKFIIPEEQKTRQDFHNIQRLVTVAGNIRFAGERNENGHSDRFWAAALSLLAGDGEQFSPLIVTSGRRRESSIILQNY